jgi:CRP/FNR family transcriptional activator FtrB
MNSATHEGLIADRPISLGCAAADLPLLGGLPKATRDILVASSTIQRFAPRADVFKDGESPEHLHIVLSGIVDLSCTYKGHECTALVMAAGDVFMPAAALYSEPYLVSARALTASRVLMIDAVVVSQHARNCTELALSL